MREIKFRAWDSYLKKMVFEGFHIWGEVTEFDLIKLHCYENPNPDYKHSLQRANDMVFMQYTGLKDKNGKEIYEGDVVKIPSIEYGDDNPFALQEIIIEHGCPFWKDTVTGKKELIYNFIGDSDFDEDAEVIGNIYENPELLGEQK